MTEVAFLLPFAFLVYAAPFSRPFRQVENIACGIMGADTGERSAAGPVENFDLREIYGTLLPKWNIPFENLSTMPIVLQQSSALKGLKKTDDQANAGQSDD